MVHTCAPKKLKRWFDSVEFEQQYHCEQPLGTWLDADGTHFALWAPTAQQVQLNLYRDGTASAAFRRIIMRREPRGLWVHVEGEQLHEVYYDYDVTVDGASCRTQDPYAKACGVNGLRSMVIDLSRTNPDGWASDRAPARQAEDVIYEIHVKDFSWDPHSGVPEQMRGKYAALTLADTTIEGQGCCPTCLNHARKLGVTHIQLMPVYDYGSVDEADGRDAFNWGYDPVNYNVPEGSYASDAQHGEVRVRELKEAILSMHRQGFRVIMDVVYNHTYRLKESCLFRTVPWYFYRQEEDGQASNGSGCGSEIASERSMVARYILDSVLYWAEEYHMDGFRFDLMGMLDVPLMNRIQQELDKRYGKGEKLLYGEPWAGGVCHPAPGTALAHKANLKLLDSTIGAFCDNTRDAVKGNVMEEGSCGFVNGAGISAETLAGCVRGWAGECGDFAAPSQTITYLSSHDDWTLWDKLVCTMDQRRGFIEGTERVIQANKLAFALLTGCQGRLFMLSGEEFGRTKMGVKNSYNAAIAINRLDWSRCSKNHALVEYYRGLIALRKQQPALCDKSIAAGERLLAVRQLDRDAAALLLDNGSDGLYAELLLAYNASEQPGAFHLPEGEWVVLADGNSSYLWQSPGKAAGKAVIPAMSALFLGKIRG